MRLALAALLVVMADQASKAWIIATLPLHRSVEVIPGIFHLTHVRNTGAAFGMLAAAQGGAGAWTWRTALFSATALTALGAIALLYRHERRQGANPWLGLGLIAGGAVGNLIDRLRCGAVTDFLDFFYQGHHWPAFNLADSAITVGAALYIWHALRHPAGPVSSREQTD